jgi:hypothetical protein
MLICLKSLPSESWHIILQKIKEKFEIWGTYWLNPTGRLVLIKYVLSSLPIYHFSSLLAPMGIKKYLAQDIQKFLWQGGKSNTNRLHLANWNLVRSPKDHRGLGIRDPKLVNIALGTKLLWRMVMGKNKWWKKSLMKKNLKGIGEYV